MNHIGTKEIETSRLLLRKFVTGDETAMFNNWVGSSAVTECLRWPTHTDIEVTKKVLSDWVNSYENKDFYLWAIVLKELNEPIGSISVVDKNERLDIAHIGYCIGSSWWRQGITSEAFSAIIPFLFNEVKVNRIESQHDPVNNPNSGKVMAKCGLKYEGTLRQADFSNKGIVDAAMYSLLADEYYEMILKH